MMQVGFVFGNSKEFLAADTSKLSGDKRWRALGERWQDLPKVIPDPLKIAKELHHGTPLFLTAVPKNNHHVTSNGNNGG